MFSWPEVIKVIDFTSSLVSFASYKREQHRQFALEMSFCSNIFNYSDFISAIDLQWNRTRSPISTAQRTTNIADLNNADQNFIINIVRTLTNDRYFIISLFILMAVIVKVRLTSLKQQYQHRKDALLRILFNLSCFGVFVVLLPILLTAWLCVLCYRKYIHFLIRVSQTLIRLG